MIYYPISKNCETRWSLFTDKCTNFSCNNGYNISCVLSQVQQVFLNTFGAAVVNAHPVLAVLPTNDNPVTFREYSIIFLSANGAFYNQYIYQFSHELCHFMVSNNVCMPFRWFEETLCQAMSWYALHQIYLMRDDQPLVQMASLYPTIESYIKSSTDERMDLRGIPVSAFVKTNLAYLQKECYNRAANAAVAYAILPLLHQHPELWKIVPYMDRLNTDMDFRTALDTLLGLASISGSGANEFIQMLCQ